MELPKYITIEHPETYEPVEVMSGNYVKAKTKALREFGYTDLTEIEVTEQLQKILANEELNIIGMFIEKDIVLK